MIDLIDTRIVTLDRGEYRTVVIPSLRALIVTSPARDVWTAIAGCDGPEVLVSARLEDSTIYRVRFVLLVPAHLKVDAERIWKEMRV